MALVSTPVLVVAVTLVILLHRLSRIGRRPKDFPPGPPTLPLIGNIHLMPKEKEYLQFQKWAEEYGPVYSLILGTQAMIVLSSDQAIKDLLDKRSNIYSSRPGFYIGKVISGFNRVLLMEYGEQWRTLRKLMHSGLNVKKSLDYIPYQDLENKAMLMGFLEQPTLFVDHIRRYTNSLTTQMVFGFRTPGLDDPRMKQVFHNFDMFSQSLLSPAAALLDAFPVLRHVPDIFVPIKRHAKELHRREHDLFVGHYLDAKKRFKEGTAKPCFCQDLIRAQKDLNLTDALAGYTSGSLLEAGSDTTAATLVGFLNALLLYPEVPRAAQAEIDGVCGEDRLPQLADLESLPYVRGCMKESLRWMPTGVIGVPHAVIQDDEYMGYRIPKGASVLWNVWTLSNDPKRHPNPRKFDPTRWAGDTQSSQEAATNKDPTKRDHFVFGAGRRVCQGMHIADRSLFLAISRLLWAFDIRRPRDPQTGEEIVPVLDDFTDGIFVMPRPFAADIRPRSAARAALVRAEWSRARDELLDDRMQWKTVPGEAAAAAAAAAPATAAAAVGAGGEKGDGEI